MRMIFWLLMVSSLRSQSQQVIPSNEVFEKILKTNTSPPLIKGFLNRDIIHFNDTFRNVFPQYLLKHDNDLFVLVERTGLVYRLNRMPNEFAVQRMDTTKFFGYNGNAIIFSAHDTIFSFGGNGFWRNNGQLRFFNEQNKEWGLIAVDKEIPAQSNLYEFDPNSSSLFYVLLPFTDETIGRQYDNFECYRFDLNERKNHLLGSLNEHLRKLIAENPNPTIVYVPSLKGTLVSFKAKEHYLLFFEKNIALRINKPILDFFYASSFNIEPSTMFALNDTIFYTYSNDKSFRLKNQVISINDFDKTGIPIFNDPRNSQWMKAISFALFICLFVLGSLKAIRWYISKEISKRSNDKKNEDEILNPLSFTAFEINLIHKMIAISKRNEFFNVDDLNKELGLTRKALEVQKRIRTEIINRINHKFKVNHLADNDLIQRIRSEEDRRFYKYFIPTEHWNSFGQR